MSSKPAPFTKLEFYLVTPDRWQDLEKLFGERGACAGCWCMYWRLKRAEFDQKRGQGTKRALKKIVNAGQAPGILAYADGEPIGWCSVAPREAFPVLDRSRTLKRVDDQSVWSVVCFFIARPFRRKGVTVKLLTAAVEFAQQHGAKIVEGVPGRAEEGHHRGYFGLHRARVGFSPSRLCGSAPPVRDSTHHALFDWGVTRIGWSFA